MVEEYERRQLVLRAEGPGRKVLLGIVLHELRRIHDSYQNLDSRALVPCDCAQCSASSEPHAFPLEALKRAVRHQQPIQCQRSFTMANAAALIDAVFERDTTRRSEGMESGRKEVSETTSGGEPPELFISYAWKADTAIVDALNETLKGRDIRVTRDKDALRYKDSIGEFMRRLGRGTAVVVVLSEAYLRSHYCMYELLQIDKSRDLRERAFPIVLDDAGIHDPIEMVGHTNIGSRRSRPSTRQ